MNGFSIRKGIADTDEVRQVVDTLLRVGGVERVTVFRHGEGGYTVSVPWHADHQELDAIIAAFGKVDEITYEVDEYELIYPLQLVVDLWSGLCRIFRFAFAGGAL